MAGTVRRPGVRGLSRLETSPLASGVKGRLSPPMTCPLATTETPQGSHHLDSLRPGRLLRGTVPRLLGPGRCCETNFPICTALFPRMWLELALRGSREVGRGRMLLFWPLLLCSPNPRSVKKLLLLPELGTMIHTTQGYRSGWTQIPRLKATHLSVASIWLQLTVAYEAKYSSINRNCI